MLNYLVKKRQSIVDLCLKYKVDSTLFYISFGLCLVGQFLIGTTFTYKIGENVPYKIMLIGCLIGVFKIILCNKFENLKDAILILFVSLVIWASAVNAYSWDMIYYCVLVIAATKVRYENIIKLFLGLNVLGLLITFTAAKLGLIYSVVNARIDSTSLRFALGTVYPTDLAARLFYIELFYVLLKKFKLTLPEYIILISLTVFSYYVTDTRLDLIMMMLILACTFFNNAVQTIIKKLGKLGIITILGSLIAMMIAMTYLYHPKIAFLGKINNALSGRLSVGNIAFKKYNVTMFGQSIAERGNGGIHKGYFDYFYIDSSYIRLLMINGIVCFLIIVALLIYLSNKFLDSRMYSLEIALIFVALSSIIDQHFLEISYQCILLATFANTNYFRSNKESY